jgi:hypothetical protein
VINPWLTLGAKAMALGMDAQSVIALRTLRLAAGGARAQAEATRMIAEKFAALSEAQTKAMVAVMTGRKSHVVANRAMAVVHKKVRANKRRLSRR